MPRAIVIGTDGSIEIKNPVSLQDYKDLVGGWLESIPFVAGCAAFLNGDGKGLGLPFNLAANCLCDAAKISLGPDDYIVGPMVIVGPVVGDGDTSDVPDDVIAWTRAMLGRPTVAN